jgi:hypothetical protein
LNRVIYIFFYGSDFSIMGHSDAPTAPSPNATESVVSADARFSGGMFVNTGYAYMHTNKIKVNKSPIFTRRTVSPDVRS